MRSFGSVLLGILAILVLGAIGVGIYDAGLQQGIAQSANLPAGSVPYYAYGYGFHGFGFGGLLGLIFPILFLFLIFGLLRAAFRGGRGGWGHRGYGRWGYGPMSDADRDAWMRGPGSQIADLHRRLHEESGTGAAGSSTSSSSGGSSGPGSAA